MRNIIYRKERCTLNIKNLESFKDFNNYCNEIKFENRFFVSDKYTKYFKLYLQENTETVDVQDFYRARINSVEQGSEVYQDEHIGMPKVSIASSTGRANPKGINYFYLSENINTCIAEIRPNFEDYVTVATFRNKTPMNILRISDTAYLSDELVEEDDENLSSEEKQKRVDQILDFMIVFMYAFSRKINGDPEIEYSPFQYFVEYCKKFGLDGISFDSSVMNKIDGNYNYVFFSDENFEIVDKTSKRIREISYRIE